MTRPWPEEYYDIVDHYFWAPDRLGHLSNPLRALKKPAEIMARLRRIEEPLNHILGVFFAIAPSSFVQELYRTHTGIEIDVPLRLLGRDIHKAFGINDATQPDFAFQGSSSFVTLEAKGRRSLIDRTASQVCFASLACSGGFQANAASLVVLVGCSFSEALSRWLRGLAEHEGEGDRRFAEPPSAGV